MLGYCVCCRAKKNMVNASRTLMKNGRKAMIGNCDCCGTKMNIAGKWDSDFESAQTESSLFGANNSVSPASSLELNRV